MTSLFDCGNMTISSVRCGDVRKGLSVARDLGSRQVTRECAEILEQMKQLNEAASLYESAQYYDKVRRE